MPEPYVSIVLVTRNGAATLPLVLDAVARQRAPFPFEVVAVDSGSTDGTLDLLRARVDRVIEVPGDGFDHGLTRNLGIEQAAGELIVLLVQDAVPASEGWLAALTVPFVADAQVAGAFARQQPRSDATAIARHYLARSPASSAVPRTVTIPSANALEALDPMAQLECCTFDNVCSCIRRSIWMRHPFRSTPIAEDLEWARGVLLAGYKLAYVPHAEVVHSHDRPARYEFLRTYLLHRRLYELFGLRTIPTLPLLLRALGSSLALHHRLAGQDERRSSARARGVALALAWPLGQYLGAASAVRRWPPLRCRI
jgi:rhamnosyltransferase